MSDTSDLVFGSPGLQETGGGHRAGWWDWCLEFRVQGLALREIGILLPNKQRQHRALHVQKDALPYALR